MMAAVRAWVLVVSSMVLMLAAPDTFARELKVLVMGDSLSAAYGLRPEQGWVALADARSDRYVFHNASISGETTAGGRTRIAAQLQRVKPDIVVIELGANDGLRGLPLTQMGANLGWMIGASRAAGARVLLLGMRLPPNMGRYADDFHRTYVLISQRLDVPLLPFFLEPLGTERKWFQADNLHPTVEAQAKILDHVWPALRPLLR